MYLPMDASIHFFLYQMCMCVCCIYVPIIIIKSTYTKIVSTEIVPRNKQENGNGLCLAGKQVLKHIVNVQKFQNEKKKKLFETRCLILQCVMHIDAC